MLRLRHLAGMPPAGRRPPSPSIPGRRTPSACPRPTALPEIAPADLTPELLRAGILRDGCLLVRGLVDREAALRVRRPDRPRRSRSASGGDGGPAPGYYEEFEPARRASARSPSAPWIKEGGGVLAADSPMLSFEMLELFARAGLPQLVGGLPRRAGR